MNINAATALSRQQPVRPAESLTPLMSAHPASASPDAFPTSNAAMVKCCAAHSFIVFQVACHGPSYQQST